MDVVYHILTRFVKYLDALRPGPALAILPAMNVRTVIRTDEVVLGPIVSTQRPPDEVRVCEDPVADVKRVYVESRLMGTLESMTLERDQDGAGGYVLTVVPS